MKRRLIPYYCKTDQVRKLKHAYKSTIHHENTPI